MLTTYLYVSLKHDWKLVLYNPNEKEITKRKDLIFN